MKECPKCHAQIDPTKECPYCTDDNLQIHTDSYVEEPETEGKKGPHIDTRQESPPPSESELTTGNNGEFIHTPKDNDGIPCFEIEEAD